MYDKNIVSDDNRKQEASADHRLLDFPGNLNHIISRQISFHIIGKSIMLIGGDRDVLEARFVARQLASKLAMMDEENLIAVISEQCMNAVLGEPDVF